jgi:hypothetical protein
VTGARGTTSRERGRAAGARGHLTGERGQATVEFVALTLVCCVVFGALAGLRGAFDGRELGGFFTRHLVCAAGGRCDRDEAELAAAYGERDAATVRALAPNLVFERGERELPVDWRECRLVRCSLVADDPALDAHFGSRSRRTGRIAQATAFTHVLRRAGRLYIQYWLYYPDSNSTLAGSDDLWARSWLLPQIRRLVDGTTQYPGYHRDDWEGAFVRVDPDGSTWIRASSHGRFQSCKWSFCRDKWARRTGWVRVSRGSHSGHIPFATQPGRPTPRRPFVPRYIARPPKVRLIPLRPGRGLSERSTTGEGLRLVPLETLDPGTYRPLDRDVLPPWDKEAYPDPLAGKS